MLFNLFDIGIQKPSMAILVGDPGCRQSRVDVSILAPFMKPRGKVLRDRRKPMRIPGLKDFAERRHVDYPGRKDFANRRDLLPR